MHIWKLKIFHTLSLRSWERRHIHSHLILLLFLLNWNFSFNSLMLFLKLLLQVFPTLRVGSSTFYYYIILSHESESVVTQSFLTLWDPMESSVHGIPQTRILECIAVPLSRGSSQPRNWTRVSPKGQILYRLSHQGTTGCLIF